MTFKDKYEESSKWVDKVLILEIFHLTMCMRDSTWTVSKTANEFQVSIGLVSENLRLANLIHARPELIKIESRVDALKRLR